MNPEEEWISRGLEGERGACDQLARSFLPLLFRYFLSAWQVSAHEAEELTQDTFLEVWSSLAKFEGKAWRGWLMTIARRVAWKTLKARGPGNMFASLDHEEMESHPALESEAPSQEELVMTQDEFAKMKRLISHLRPEYRELLHLYSLEELSTEELALSMEIPMGTIKIWLYRARNELRQQWTSQNTQSIKTFPRMRSRR